MSEQLHALWLQDVRGVQERARERLWWKAGVWVNAAGLLCAFILWGWPTSMFVAVTVAIAVVALTVPFTAFEGVPTSRLVDRAIVVGLVSTGVLALTVASAPAGLGVAVLMVGTSSPCRHGIHTLGRRGLRGRSRQAPTP